MSDEVWCVMTVTQGGTVSLLKNLTEDECRGVVQRLGHHPSPWTAGAIYTEQLASLGREATQGWVHTGSNGIAFVAYGGAGGGGSSGIQYIDPTLITRIEFWGSRDSELEVWPKPGDYEARLEEAMNVRAVVERVNAALDGGAVQ